MHPKVCLADNSDRLPVDRANHGLLDIDVGKLGKASTKDAGDMGSQRRFVGGSTKLVNRGWRPNTSPETNGIPVVIPLQLKVVKEQLHALRIENHILANASRDGGGSSTPSSTVRRMASSVSAPNATVVNVGRSHPRERAATLAEGWSQSVKPV